jgi:hypothetical protein
MAKKSEDGLTIADMDFGDFIAPDDNFLTPPVPKGEEKEEKEEKVEEEEIDVNKALAGEVEDSEEEDKAPEEEEAEEETEEKEPPASSDDESFTLVLARYQLEQGVLSSLDEEELNRVLEEEGEAAAFKYLIQNEVELNTKAVTEQLTEYSKEYSELRRAGFSPEEAGNHVLTVEALDSITDEDIQDEDKEDLRRTILKENYKATTNFSEAKIDRLVKRAFDINADVEDAQEALESLREAKKQELAGIKAAQKRQQEEAQEAYNKQLQAINSHVESLSEIVPGKKINKQTKSKIVDLITKPVKQNEDGYALNAIWNKRSEDPVTFDTIMGYLYLSGVFDGNWDQITKTVNTNLTKKLEKKLSERSSSLLGGKHVMGNKSVADKTREDMIGPMKHLLGD